MKELFGGLAVIVIIACGWFGAIAFLIRLGLSDDDAGLLGSLVWFGALALYIKIKASD